MYISRAPYSIDAQTEIETLTRFRSEERSVPFTIDVAWLSSLCRERESWPAKIMSDVVVAWEVDSTKSHKDIRTSIDNLATLNPRLGIELLLIGGNEGAISGFEGRFKTAIQAARIKAARIIVIHDVIFSFLYFKIRNRHPETLYKAYLDVVRTRPELRTLLSQKWEDLLNRTITESNFMHGLNENLLDRLRVSTGSDPTN